MIFYFSGTGNSRWVAETLRDKSSSERLLAIGDVYKSESVYSLASGERVGFVFPVYSWGPPAWVLSFLAAVRFAAPPSYLYFVCTCGDDTGKTLDIFRDAVSRRGWSCQAGFSVTMPNTYVCLPFFDVDKGEVAEAKCRQAMSRVKEIKQLIDSRESRFDCFEGSFPRLKSYVLRPLFNRYCTSPKRFAATGDCIACGKCVQSCPLHNISFKDGHPVWGTACTMCLSCYHHCPAHAVAYGRQTANKGQYVCRLDAASAETP